jgi:peptidoglycan/xylan/chitin deacetylase (PgdA/CDA1 family)
MEMVMLSKLFYKKVGLKFLAKLGILRLLHYKNRQQVTVLVLHGVMEQHEKTSWSPLRPQLPPSELQRMLEVLSEYYQFVNIDQCVNILEEKIPPIDHALLLTFDDGYRNTIDYALPVCEQFGIKPVLFVATGHIDSGEPFWFDRLDYALQQNMGEIISLEFQGVEYCFDATSRHALKASYQKFRDMCKHTFTDDITMNQLFNALSEMLELRSGKALSDIIAEDDWTSIASWPQLREAVKCGRIDIASHTVDHWRLNSLSEEKILSQLQQSKICVEQKVNVDCQYFCYPNGNYNKLSVKLVKESGYRAAFSTDVGLCQSKDDLMTLKRFNFPSNKTKAELLYILNR